MVRSRISGSLLAVIIALGAALFGSSAAAQQRVPANGEVVECPVISAFEDATFVVRCGERWAGMVVPVAHVNGWSGFMFCGPMAADYICYSDGVINVADHPEPLKNGSLTCTTEWNPEDEISFACKQD